MNRTSGRCRPSLWRRQSRSHCFQSFRVCSRNSIWIYRVRSLGFWRPAARACFKLNRRPSSLWLTSSRLWEENTTLGCGRSMRLRTLQSGRWFGVAPANCWTGLAGRRRDRQSNKPSMSQGLGLSDEDRSGVHRLPMNSHVRGTPLALPVARASARSTPRAAGARRAFRCTHPNRSNTRSRYRLR